MKRRRRMDASLVILLALTLIALAVALARDPALVVRGFQSTGRLLGGVWIELALGFVLAGLIDVLVPAAALTRWLGDERLGQGIAVGWAAGLLLPGGPYLVFPVVANLFRSGAAPGDVRVERRAGVELLPRASPRFRAQADRCRREGRDQ